MKWITKGWIVIFLCFVMSTFVFILPAVAEENTAITSTQSTMEESQQPLVLTINAKGKEKEIAVVEVRIKNEGAIIKNVRFHVEGVNEKEVTPFIRLENTTSEGDPVDVLFGKSLAESTIEAGGKKTALYYLEVPPDLEKTEYTLRVLLKFNNFRGSDEEISQEFTLKISTPNIFVSSLRWVIDNLAKYFWGYGIAIILLAFLIKLILWPLNKITMKSQHQMMSLQPKINEINQLYKTDPQKKQEAIMQLYKDEKINPASGCLPMLPQLAILMALYAALQSYTPLFKDSFLWLKSLGSPDPYFIFPILAGVTTFLQSLSSGQTKDPQSKMLVYFMPVFFFFIMMRFPAGLSLFWTVYGLFSWIQQWFFNISNKNEPKVTEIKMPEPKKSKLIK